jgi:hypothetical protein
VVAVAEAAVAVEEVPPRVAAVQAAAAQEAEFSANSSLIRRL